VGEFVDEEEKVESTVTEGVDDATGSEDGQIIALSALLSEKTATGVDTETAPPDVTTGNPPIAIPFGDEEDAKIEEPSPHEFAPESANVDTVREFMSNARILLFPVSVMRSLGDAVDELSKAA